LNGCSQGCCRRARRRLLPETLTAATPAGFHPPEHLLLAGLSAVLVRGFFTGLSHQPQHIDFLTAFDTGQGHRPLCMAKAIDIKEEMVICRLWPTLVCEKSEKVTSSGQPFVIIRKILPGTCG
jgi:hypothetical protein